MTDCPLCDEPMDDDPAPSPLYTRDGVRTMHRVCALREVLGGIGHLLDHEHFCLDKRDPDAGLDYRTSALLVDTWVRRKGVDHVLGQAETGSGGASAAGQGR